MTVPTGQVIRGIMVLALFVSVAGFFIVVTVRKAEDPARMVFKWILTAGVGNSVRWVTFLIFLRGGQILSSPSALVLGRGWPQPLARRHSLRSPKILLVAPANLKRTVPRKHFPQGVFTRWQTTSSKATLLPEPGPGHAPAL